MLWPALQEKKAAAAAKLREKKLAAEWATEKAHIDALAKESAQRAAVAHGAGSRGGGPPQRKYVAQKATPTPAGGPGDEAAGTITVSEREGNV